MSQLLGAGAAEARYIVADAFVVQIVSLMCILFGVGAALYSCYQLALVVLGSIPFVVLCFIVALENCSL